MIGQTISHYRIVLQLGGGGRRVVYEAEELKLDRHDALKFFSEEFTTVLWVSPLTRIFAVR